MLTEDHLLRILRLAVAALARIAGLRAALLHQDALFLVEQTLEEVFGLRTDLIRRLDDRRLIEALTYQEILDKDRLQVVADLYKAEAEILVVLGQEDEAYWSALRALNFYLEVGLRGGADNLPAPQEALDSLLVMLESYDLPPETLFSLYSYFEQAGRYREAGEALQSLTGRPEAGLEMAQERQAFLGRLLALPDEALEAGGLTRLEVVQALSHPSGEADGRA